MNSPLLNSMLSNSEVWTPLEALLVAIRYYQRAPGEVPRWPAPVVGAVAQVAGRGAIEFAPAVRGEPKLWAEILDTAAGINDVRERRERRRWLRTVMTGI